jgi:hypothetical protein
LNRLIEGARPIAVETLSATVELLAIIEDLEATGIAALAVKGPVAGLDLYGDVALRPFVDLDVLIAPKDRNRAIERLAAQGYRPASNLDAVGWRRFFHRFIEMCWIHPETAVVVDLHWALVDPRYRCSAVLAGCEERAVSLSIGARRIPTLCPEDTLLHFLLHAAKHDWSELRSLVDVALVIEMHDDLDWKGIARAVARAPGCQRMLATGPSSRRVAVRHAHTWGCRRLDCRRCPRRRTGG